MRRSLATLAMLQPSTFSFSFWTRVVGFILVAIAGTCSSEFRVSKAVGAEKGLSASPAATSPPERASRAAHTAAEVDRLLAEETLGDAPPATNDKQVPLADDEALLRRLSLDLIGRAPTPEETTIYALDTAPNKRAEIVDKLMEDPRYGENWGRYWRDVIFYRRTEDRALIGAETCSDYLAKLLNDNASWDKVAAAFVTAQGDVQEDGATALIFAHRGEPEAVVAEVTRIFNGIQISCAQCHDHPTDRWKRDEFHKMAAFFPRIALRPNPQQGPLSFTVAVTDVEPRFRPRNAMMRVRGTAEHYMPDLKDPQAKGTLMQPVFFVSGQSLDVGTKDADRRGQFASWLTASDNPWFARALVNRLWSELVGEGFYEPVDDMGPDRECSAPKTLDYLAASFTTSGYDVKQLFRTITSTQAYQRESRSRRDPDETPFASNTSQRLRGDQLFNQLSSLLGIADADAGRRGGQGQQALRRGVRFQFNQVFGYDPSNSRDEVTGSIPQALVLMNSPVINGGISAQRGMLARLLSQIKKDDDLTVELYLRAVGREPTEKEIAFCRDYVGEVGNRGEAYEDILWSLVNSTEFLHRK